MKIGYTCWRVFSYFFRRVFFFLYYLFFSRKRQQWKWTVFWCARLLGASVHMRFFFISYRRACLSGSGVHDEFLIDVHEIRQSFFILPSEIDAPLYRKKQQFFFGSFFLSSRCISLFIQTEPRKRKIVIKELETPPQKKQKNYQKNRKK